MILFVITIDCPPADSVHADVFVNEKLFSVLCTFTQEATNHACYITVSVKNVGNLFSGTVNKSEMNSVAVLHISLKEGVLLYNVSVFDVDENDDPCHLILNESINISSDLQPDPHGTQCHY